MRVGTIPTSWKRGLKPRWGSGWRWLRQPLVKKIEGWISRREERRVKIAQAKAEIERRAKECYARGKAGYDEKMARRQAKEKRTGGKPGGRAPKEPEPGRTIKTRSTSPMKNRASCRYPVVVLNRLITARSEWMGTVV
jgi:hypothetical protein